MAISKLFSSAVSIKQQKYITFQTFLPACMRCLKQYRLLWAYPDSPLQSAYCTFHSTETALLKLTKDIMETIDSRKITFLTALDMSATFDTRDHITLLHRLQHTFGLSGYIISWIRSYLTNRSSFVKIDSSSSPFTTILTGVPRGSFSAHFPLSFSYHQLKKS